MSMTKNEIGYKEKITQIKLENHILKMKHLQNFFYENKVPLEKDKDVSNKFSIIKDNQKDLKEFIIFKIKNLNIKFKTIIIIFKVLIIYLLFHYLLISKLYPFNLDILNDKNFHDIFNAYINSKCSNLINLNDNKLIINTNIIEKILSNDLIYLIIGINSIILIYKVKFSLNRKKEKFLYRKEWIRYLNTKNYKNIIKLLIIMDLFFKISLIKKLQLFELYFSNITLKVKGIGYNDILGYDKNEGKYFGSDYYPNEVHINGNKQNIVNYTYHFNQTDNIVKLIWKNNINNCREMFRRCYGIVEIDLFNFDTSQVTDMTSMFVYCHSLTSVNLSNFDTSKVTNMGFMFYHCYSLISLDLSSFDTSKVTRMSYMFESCEKLEFINLKNFNENSLSESNDVFKYISNNIIICINENNNINEILSQIKSHKCYKNDCSENWKLKQKKLIEQLDICVEKCDNITKDNDSCFKEPIGYYFDKNDSLYKPCYNSCETCEIKGDYNTHNCLKCNIDYPFGIRNKNNYFNCYENYSYYYNYYIESINILISTNHISSIIEYPTLTQDKTDYTINEIYESNIKVEDKLNVTINNQDKTEYTTNEIYEITNKVKDKLNITINNEEEKVKYYNNILENIEKEFTSSYYNTSNLDNGQDEITEINDIKITLTTTQNQKNKTNTNMTTIDLGKCEILLKAFYNISENETIYIKKIDVNQPGMKIPKIEYSIYSKLSGTHLEKLNLSICDNTKISLSVPVEINESLDKLNTTSGYFNDICYTSTSDSGTDISLKDRRNEFINNNKTVCQENCDFSEYDSDIKKANCSCQVKESTNNYSDMNINTTKIYEIFEDNKNDISNLGVASCNVFASTENIESNTGFFLLLIILAIFVVVFIIFCSKGYNSLENEMDEVIHKRFKSKEKNRNKKEITDVFDNKNNNLVKRRRSKKKKKKSHDSMKMPLNENEIKDINRRKNNSSMLQNKIINNENKKQENPNINNIKPDTDYEFNWLSYKDALKFDKRSNCEYYASLLRSKQLFIFTFCSFNDYNSGIIKKFMLFLSFALHYTINALFFNQSTMHQIYEDKGKFNFLYQIPKILLSAIISTIILRLILQFLVLTDKDVLQVKKQENKTLAINLKEN